MMSVLSVTGVTPTFFSPVWRSLSSRAPPRVVEDVVADMAENVVDDTVVEGFRDGGVDEDPSVAK